MKTRMPSLDRFAPHDPCRRALLGGLLALGGAWPALALEAPRPAEDRVGARLAPWRPGGLDIHHIATGRGNAELLMAPDGGTLLIDAGAMYAPPPMDLELRPTSQRRPGEWVGRYARRRLLETGRSGIDYAILTHLHPDHLGDVAPDLPEGPGGGYRLTGISDVDTLAPIGAILDRGYPDYQDVEISAAPFARNYIAFIRARERQGRAIERLKAGSASQVGLTSGRGHEAFEVRTIAVNGEVWTGRGEVAERVFPALAGLAPEDRPDENSYSAAIRVKLGDFGYYAPGDLTSNTLDGALPWRNIGAKAASAAGRVDVAAAAHHGLFDGTDGDVVRALRPRIWVIDAWHVSHPTITTLERLFSQRLYAGDRDVLATGLSEPSWLVTERLARRFASRNGHIVIRVAPGGASFHVAVTDNADEADTVIHTLGPFSSMAV